MVAVDLSQHEDSEDELKQLQARLDDWGLNYPADYLLPRFRVWHRSNYTVYPNGLAYDDQPLALLDDFDTLELVYALFYKRMSKKVTAGNGN